MLSIRMTLLKRLKFSLFYMLDVSKIPRICPTQIIPCIGACENKEALGLPAEFNISWIFSMTPILILI